MKEDWIETMEKTKTLKLTKVNLFWHYSIIPLVLLVPVFSLWRLLEYHIFNNYEGIRKPEFENFEYLCLTVAILLFIIQKKRLQLKKFEIKTSENLFRDTVEVVSKELKWEIDYYSDNFVRAHRNWNWTESWGEMITIIRNEDQILINSICDPNSVQISVTSWGWNKKNVQTFISTLKNNS